MKNYSDAFINNTSKVSDKWSAYLPVYDQIVENFEAHNILEIGVQNGGSLEVWSKIYPNAKSIIGLDVNEACAELEFDSEQIRVIVSDATKKETASSIKEITDSFDLVVDDGSHRSDHIIASLIHFLPMVAPNGFYVIEDLHASYWPSWGGGLYKKQSAMNFLYRIADVLNLEHWGTPQETKDFLEAPIELNDGFISAVQRVKSVSFLNSMAVLELFDQKENSTIGIRKVTGQVAKVASSVTRLDGQKIEYSPDKVDHMLVQLRKDIDEASISSQKATEEILVLQKSHSRISSELSVAHQTMETQKDEIEQAKTDLVRKAQELAESRLIRENLESENGILSKTNESLSERLAVSMGINLRLQGTILQIKESKSWKLTKPLRRLYEIISINPNKG